MKRPRFSIITPAMVWNDYRRDCLKRAIESVEKQTFKDFEYIVVNDGSTQDFVVPGWVNLINKEHKERVIAQNRGLKESKGEIICFLDSDDEYEPNYLEKVDSYFRENPKYKMFNFGWTCVTEDGNTYKRDAFKPKELKVGHEIFGGGNIAKGTFVFDRSVYNKLGAFPKENLKNIDCSELHYGTSYGAPAVRDLFMGTPFDFSAAAQIEFPEIRQFFMVNVESEPTKVIKELGNPWGDDYYLFYKYTRKYHSKPMDDYLYIAHIKEGVK